MLSIKILTARLFKLLVKNDKNFIIALGNEVMIEICSKLTSNCPALELMLVLNLIKNHAEKEASLVGDLGKLVISIAQR